VWKNWDRLDGTCAVGSGFGTDLLWWTISLAWALGLKLYGSFRGYVCCELWV
jgi:hypothetical protein